MNFILHGRCKESVTCGGQKREFTWQVRGIGHVVKIVAGAVFRGRCHTLPKHWQVCHSKGCVSRGMRREAAPWIICFEVEGLNF